MKNRLIAVCAMTAIIGGSVQNTAQDISAKCLNDNLKTKGYIISIGGEACREQVEKCLKDMGIDIENIKCPAFVCPEQNAPEVPEVEETTKAPEITTEEITTKVPETTTTETATEETTTRIPEITTENPTTNVPETTTSSSEKLTFAEQVVELVNEERRKAGLNELTLDKNIENAALIRAKEIETNFSHTRPDGSGFSTVLMEQGISFRGAGENIAWGQNSPKAVMNAWMNSSGHRANILNAKYTKIGVGYYQNASGRKHWTQLFTY